MPRQRCIGKRVIDLETPAFLVDLNVFKNNCKKMTETAELMEIQLRGQTKTHKTIEGGIIQTGGKKRCIVTSTLDEAEFYANAGFDDILYGYPLIASHMDRNYELAKKLAEYHVMITHMESIQPLLMRNPPDNKKWSVFLKMDCANNRAGFWWEGNACIETAKELIKHKDTITLKGLYVHCGNSYNSKTTEGVEKVRDDTIDMLKDVKERMKLDGITIDNIGIGSTPSCSHISEKLKVLTEIHPGNYVFYDVQQLLLNSCSECDIAGRVATRIIGHYPERNQMLIDCGFTALTKQGFADMNSSYAYVQDHPNLAVVAMTQEIGFIQPKNLEEKLDYNALPVGSILILLPYHSCATAAMHSVYYVHENGIIVEEWKPTRGW